MKDACSIIKKELSSGAKTSKQLREACEKAGIVESTFYYHLKQLVKKLGEVKKVAEENGKGGIIMKYVLAEKREEKYGEVLWGCTSGGIRSLTVGDVEIEYPPNRMLLELAAWIRHKPAKWDVNDDNVKKAKLCLEHCQYLVPKIGETHEDPDSYALMWSDEALRELHLDESTFSRFFTLKSIYDSMTDDLSQKTSNGEAVFLGAYYSPVVVDYVGYYTRMQPLRLVGRPNVYDVIEEPQNVCVAVRKETNTSLHVVYIETRKGDLDKAWVSGLTKQLKTKKTRMISYDSLKEDDKRDLLLNLRGVIEQHRLLISSRYTTLFDDLTEFSYKKPSSGYVYALALAVDLASP